MRTLLPSTCGSRPRTLSPSPRPCGSPTRPLPTEPLHPTPSHYVNPFRGVNPGADAAAGLLCTSTSTSTSPHGSGEPVKMHWKLGGSDGSSSRRRYCSEQGGRDSFSKRDHDDDEEEGRRGRGDGRKDKSWHRGWLSRSKSGRHEPYRRKDSRGRHPAYDDMALGANCTGSGPLRRRYNGKKRATTTSPTKKGMAC